LKPALRELKSESDGVEFGHDLNRGPMLTGLGNAQKGLHPCQATGPQIDLGLKAEDGTRFCQARAEPVWDGRSRGNHGGGCG